MHSAITPESRIKRWGQKATRARVRARARVCVLAAAMWNRQYMIALGKPTNYIDKETLKALVR